MSLFIIWIVVDDNAAFPWGWLLLLLEDWLLSTCKYVYVLYACSTKQSFTFCRGGDLDPTGVGDGVSWQDRILVYVRSFCTNSRQRGMGLFGQNWGRWRGLVSGKKRWQSSWRRFLALSVDHQGRRVVGRRGWRGSGRRNRWNEVSTVIVCVENRGHVSLLLPGCHIVMFQTVGVFMASDLCHM